MNFIADTLVTFGLLKRDLDYHLLRAAMVIIFAWFGYDKWFESEIRGTAAHNHPRPVYLLDDSGFGHSRHRHFSRRLRMDLWHVAASGFLEQESGHARRPRFDLHLHRSLHGHAVRS